MKTILVDAVFCFIIEKNGKFEIFQEMQAMLDTFPNPKIILTNAGEENFEKYKLNEVPYPFFTLRNNPGKTDPKYFELMLEKFSLSKDEVIYFEHSLEAVKSAQTIGIASYHYDEEKRDLKALKNFLTENL